MLSADYVRQPTRTAIGDLADRVETAKPFIKDVKPGSGSAMRRERVAQNAAAADSGPEAAPPEPDSALPRPPGPRLYETPRRVATIKISTGLGEPRAIALTKDQTTLGRSGVQVVRITRIGDAFALTQIEGEQPATVNGDPPQPEGTLLEPGDVIEVVGSRVEFLGLT